MHANDTDGKTITRTHIGITRIVVPDTQGAISVVDAETLGFGWDDGPFLGWRSGSWIGADPSECQMVVIVRSPSQAEHAARVIAALEGQNPCIADFTGSLAQRR